MKFTVTGFSFVCLLLLVISPVGRGTKSRVPLVLAGLGTVAYLLSSVMNDTSLMEPDVVAFAAFALYFCGVFALTRNLEDLFTVFTGVSLGTCVFYALGGTALTQTGLFAALWKYGLAPPITVGVLYAAIVFSRSRIVPPLLLMTLAGASVALNYRSHAMICGAALLLVAVDLIRRRPLQFRGKLLLLGAFALGSMWALQAAAHAGLLGTSLREKIEMQSSQDVPVILAGRSEPPLSITAILDRPIFGWGSANNISAGVYEDAREWAIEIGFDSNYPFQYVWKLSDGSLSLHSLVLGSWAEAGILGVLLPLWLVWACGFLIYSATLAGRWSPLLIYLGLQGLWDLFFSPWSYNLPIVYAVIAVAYVLQRQRYRESRSARDTPQSSGDPAPRPSRGLGRRTTVHGVDTSKHGSHSRPNHVVEQRIPNSTNEIAGSPPRHREK
jgi:O-antigen ligase